DGCGYRGTLRWEAVRSRNEGMVDREARQELAVALHRLVTGQMTNDQFDEVFEACVDSEDAAVAAIANFGWGLYSSWLLWPYRLKGRHASLGSLHIARPSPSDFCRSLPLQKVRQTRLDSPELPCGVAPVWAHWLSTPEPPTGRDRSCFPARRLCH